MSTSIYGIFTPYLSTVNIAIGSFSSVVQGTWGFSTNASEVYGHISNTTATNGDCLEYTMYLAAGTYTFYAMGVRSTLGNMIVSVDGVDVATFNWNGAALYNHRQVQTGIVITSSSIKAVRIRTDSQIAIQEMAWYQTS